MDVHSAFAGAAAARLPDQKLAPRDTDEESVRQGRALLASTAAAFSYEGLEHDDVDRLVRTPFVPPSLPLAVEGQREETFLGQRANPCCTDLDTIR
jgi:hypothetical protein